MSINTVSGTIYDAFDAPMAAVTVQAFDKDIRTEEFLGAAVTDAKGSYNIKYDGEYTQAENNSADIFIRVFNIADGVLGVLATSPVYFNVSPDVTLDLKIDGTPYKGISEFDALVNKITPLLENQRVTMAELVEDGEFKDISFLANETGEDAAKIALIPIAFKKGEQTKLASDILYGLFRLNFPTGNELFGVKSESIANGINTAISLNIISAKWGIPTQIDSILQTFNQFAAAAVLSGTDDKSKAFTQVIGAALPEPEQQLSFVNVFFANENTPENFWKALAQQPGFNDPNVVAGIQSALQLNLLTNNTPPLTALLFKEQQQNPALKDLRGFASFTKEDWHSRISQLVASGELELKTFPPNIEGDTLEEKAVNYAESITLLVKTLYPTDTFASRLREDTGNAFNGTKPDLITFLTNNNGYDFKNNNINKVFEASDLTGVQDKQSLLKELTSINLLSKILPDSNGATDDYSVISAMHQDGIDSATALINKYTPTQFAEKFAPSISAETATAIYKNAQSTDIRSTALALSIMARNNTPVYAINGATNDAPPDYESMFGDTNCDCEYCQSVYSASAYFVDILNIMHKYNPNPDGAFKKLIRRRPDLTRILLTCTNTNTALPYIDLVNELLESTLAPIPPVIVNGVPAFPQYQTTNSAEELLAYPEHVNTAAYDLLKTANSASNLPLRSSIGRNKALS
jgi:hypothetical protein